MGLFGHTWSLAIEEQFYLLWPLVLILIPSTRGRAIASGIGIAAAILIRVAVFDPAPAEIGRAYQGLDVRADALLIGCLLAIWGGSLPRWIGWIGTAGLAAALIGFQTKAVLALVGFPIIGVSTAFLIGARLPLTARPLVALGGISYGFYLWHFPIIEGTRWLAASVPPVALVVAWFVASLGAAVLSRRLVELPLLAIRERSWFLRAGRNANHRNSAGLARDSHEEKVSHRADAGGTPVNH
jgi:peptidoglycan/LPS O-acetylase OafA/YrhL